MMFLTTYLEAKTYTVDQEFEGVFSVKNVGFNSFETSHSLSLVSLPEGNPSIFTSSVYTFVTSRFDLQSGLVLCNGACFYEETLKTGDMIYGSVSFNGLSSSDDGLIISYSGLFNITGGTGLFSGAKGFGSFSGVDTYLDAVSGITKQRTAYTVTTVAEPSVHGLMLIALLFLASLMKGKFRIHMSRFA